MGKKGTKNGTCQIACLNFVKGSLKLGTQILYVKICIQICFLLFRLNLIFDDFFFPETEWEGVSFSWLFQGDVAMLGQGLLNLKFMYSEKATKFCEISIVENYYSSGTIEKFVM